jgi:hypothetical protein
MLIPDEGRFTTKAVHHVMGKRSSAKVVPPNQSAWIYEYSLPRSFE